MSSWNLQSCCFTSVTVSSSPASTLNGVLKLTFTRHNSRSRVIGHVSHVTRAAHLHLINPELALYCANFAHNGPRVGHLKRTFRSYSKPLMIFSAPCLATRLRSPARTACAAPSGSGAARGRWSRNPSGPPPALEKLEPKSRVIFPALPRRAAAAAARRAPSCCRNRAATPSDTEPHSLCKDVPVWCAARWRCRRRQRPQLLRPTGGCWRRWAARC